jgi:hypothetical protein
MGILRGRAGRRHVFVCLAAVLLVVSGCGDDGESGSGTPAYRRDDTLRLNQVQVLGSHNSYHIQPRTVLINAIKQRIGDLAEGFEYTHLPLDQQFETQGIRQIELDVFADPQGGLFANRAGLKFIGENPASGLPELSLPGLKVLHVQDIDFETTCTTFVRCLGVVKAWSDTHPLHMPMMILIEAKDDVVPITGAAIPLPINAEMLDEIDAEIHSVFPARQLITPDDVRGQHATLEEAVRTDGWPTLEQSRGRVLFCFDNGGAAKAMYIDGHPSLRGRVLFTDSAPGEPEAAFLKLNDPIGDFDRIREVVAQGFVVRTRSDADTVEARSGNTVPRDMAIASGAQWVSTDYPVPNPAFGTGYFVEIPGGMPARCNPISAPSECTALDVENPAHLTR